MDRKMIYIVFAVTNSKMGKLIRIVTHYKYNHVAISLSRDLSTLYSFARYNYDSPLVGGFVEESPLRYLYSDGQSAYIKVCEVPISSEQYSMVQKYIDQVKKNSNEYIYNTFSAILSPVARRVKVFKAYTCVEFVGNIIGYLGIAPGIKKDKFCTIEKLDKQLEDYKVFEGPISQIAIADDWRSDEYLKKNGRIGACVGTLRHFRRLIHRTFINE